MEPAHDGPWLWRPLLTAALLLAPWMLSCEDEAKRELEARVTALEAELATVRTERAALEAKKATLEERNSELEAELAAAKPTPQAADDDRPEWTKKGPTYVDAEGHRYGVGQVLGIKNPSLARVTAENRARGEIARAVGTRTAVHTSDGSTKAVKATAEITGVEIVDHWVDARDGAVYALARLNAP